MDVKAVDFHVVIGWRNVDGHWYRLLSASENFDRIVAQFGEVQKR
jgi:hypothetical protein